MIGVRVGKRQRETAHLVVLVGVFFIVGCGSSEIPTLDIQVTDSAGVRVVHVPPLSTLDLPEVRLHRAFSTRNLDGERIELFRVRDGLFLRDGSLVITNSGTSEVIIFDRDGRGSFRVGGEGQGPGEFGWLQTLLPADGNGFYAFDGRLSLFKAGGEFVETRRFDPSSLVVSLLPLAVFDDGTTIGVTGEQRFFQWDGERRDTVPLLVFRNSGEPPDTLGTWFGLERAFAKVPAGRLLVPIGFARTVYHASNGAEVAIGSSDSLSVTVYSRSLLPRLQVVAPAETRVPTERDVDRWREQMSGVIPVENPDVRRAWDAAPVRDRFPGFDGLHLDSDGRLWVGEYSAPGDTERRWIVFSHEGLPVAQVHVRKWWFRRTPGRTEILAIGDGRLALLRRTRLDEEYVEVWTFELPE